MTRREWDVLAMTDLDEEIAHSALPLVDAVLRAGYEITPLLTPIGIMVWQITRIEYRSVMPMGPQREADPAKFRPTGVRFPLGRAENIDAAMAMVRANFAHCEANSQMTLPLAGDDA